MKRKDVIRAGRDSSCERARKKRAEVIRWSFQVGTNATRTKKQKESEAKNVTKKTKGTVAGKMGFHRIR